MLFRPNTLCVASLLLAAGILPVDMGSGVASIKCWAESTALTAAQLSRIWREEFPLPRDDFPFPTESTSSVALSDAGLAPPVLGTANAAPRAVPLWRSDRPHPAVARIIVPEAGATSFGSGTLIDVREKFGMVITNWHVVRDATGTIEVVFPSGFTSKARALKVDADWDLAALVIWQPPVEPVTIAVTAPQPGDQLTICGYGQGNYRCATGRCTQYYAPRLDFPRHMVELDVEARQGDSGGPIFNQQGELAGVLFGAGQGTTLGSFGGRVGTFLATLAPDIGRAAESLAANQEPSDVREFVAPRAAELAAQPLEPFPRPPGRSPDREALTSPPPATQPPANQLAGIWPSPSPSAVSPQLGADDYQQSVTLWQPSSQDNLFEQMKTVLAVVGLLAIVMQVLRVAR